MRRRCQVWDNPRLISSGEKHLAYVHTHTFGSSPAQRNLPEKLNGVFVFARSGVHSILAPVNLLSCVICAPPSWFTPIQGGGQHWRRCSLLQRRRSAEEAQSTLLWPFQHKYPLRGETLDLVKKKHQHKLLEAIFLPFSQSRFVAIITCLHSCACFDKSCSLSCFISPF